VSGGRAAAVGGHSRLGRLAGRLAAVVVVVVVVVVDVAAVAAAAVVGRRRRAAACRLVVAQLGLNNSYTPDDK
jgi:hypothetical protein